MRRNNAPARRRLLRQSLSKQVAALRYNAGKVSARYSIACDGRMDNARIDTVADTSLHGKRTADVRVGYIVKPPIVTFPTRQFARVECEATAQGLAV